MGLTNTRRILKLILKPKPSFEITPSPPDPLFKVPQERPDIIWTKSPSLATRKSQSHVQETSFTVSSFNIGDEQDISFDDILICLKSNQIHNTSPTPTPRHRLRRTRRRLSSKSPDHDPKAFLSPDQPQATFKHSNKDLSPITEGRETFPSPAIGSLFAMFDEPMGPLAVSASRSTGKLSTTSTTNVSFETVHYFASQEYGFPLLVLVLTDVKRRTMP
ncbi:hypothetical protein EDB19DRAFT_1758221 [Suillus lakei]|nr:hypothetical protein EDB19DRAFT_1758221 [Suillus lakei]